MTAPTPRRRVSTYVASRGRARVRGRGTGSVSAFVLLFFIVLVVAAPLAAPGARASAAGEPTFQDGFIADNGQVLGFMGVLTWGTQFEPISNGSQVFAGSLLLVLYDLTRGNLSVPVSIGELGSVSSFNTPVEPLVADVLTIPVQQVTSWTTVTVTVGGYAQVYSVAVPISLLGSATSIGGLDLLVLAILSLTLIGFGLAVFAAWRTMRRALWAPPFSLLIWGHVILAAILAAIIIDFQWVDQTFAGWSPVVYTVFLWPVFWLFSLSFFNRPALSQLLRPRAPVSGRLSFDCWYVLIDRGPDRDWQILDPSWWGFWARFWGHPVRLGTKESGILRPEIFEAELLHHNVEDRASIIRRMKLRRVRRPSPAKESALDDFEVTPLVMGRGDRGRNVPLRRRQRPTKILFTPSGHPVNVEWPRLSIHKKVEVPGKMSGTGQVMVPAHTQTRLALPHYNEGKAEVSLAPIHYRTQQSVVHGWRSAEDLAMVLSDSQLDLESLKSHFETRVEQEVRQRLLARESLTGRVASDLTEEQAAEEAEAGRFHLDRLLDAPMSTDKGGPPAGSAAGG